MGALGQHWQGDDHVRYDGRHDLQKLETKATAEFFCVQMKRRRDRKVHQLVEFCFLCGDWPGDWRRDSYTRVSRSGSSVSYTDRKLHLHIVRNIDSFSVKTLWIKQSFIVLLHVKSNRW